MTADTVGGVWTYAVDLCEVLQQHNVEVHLATMGKLLNQQQHKQIRKLSNVKLYESAYKLEWMQDPWNEVELAKKWLSEIIEKVKPQLLHFNNFMDFGRKWDCKVVTVFHSDVGTWWKAVKGDEAPTEWNYYIEVVASALRNSDIVIAPSRAILEDAQDIHGAFSSVKVIYNGTELKNDSSNVKQSFIFSAGRVWDEAKNIKLLSGLAEKLVWPLYVAGDNKHPDLETAEQKYNAQFIGNLDRGQMLNMMSKAAIFTSPAKYEPFGLAVLEAANSGCALVLSDIGTFREIWADAALYFDPNNEDEYLSVLNRLIEDKVLRQIMMVKASERAKLYNKELTAEKYMAVYNQLLQPTYQKKT